LNKKAPISRSSAHPQFAHAHCRERQLRCSTAEATRTVHNRRPEFWRFFLVPKKTKKSEKFLKKNKKSVDTKLIVW